MTSPAFLPNRAVKFSPHAVRLPADQPPKKPGLCHGKADSENMPNHAENNGIGDAGNGDVKSNGHGKGNGKGNGSINPSNNQLSALPKKTLLQHATLNPATLDDVSTMLRLENEAFTNPWGRKLLQGAVLNPTYTSLVVSHQASQDMIGFCVYHPTQHKSNLDSLVIGPGYRSQGLGQWLLTHWMEAVQQSPRRYAYLTLQVNVNNTKGMRFYHRHGFKVHHLLASYYPNGDDAYHMQRKTSFSP